jgi:hypothetical protein
VTNNSPCHGYSIIKKLAVDLQDNKFYRCGFAIKIFALAASKSNNIIIIKIHLPAFEEQ